MIGESFIGILGILIILILIVVIVMLTIKPRVLQHQAAPSGAEIEAERSRADRAESLAEERKNETSSLKAEISELRARGEEEQKNGQNLTETIARLEEKNHAEQEAAKEKSIVLTSAREEMSARFKQLDEERKSEANTLKEVVSELRGRVEEEQNNRQNLEAAMARLEEKKHAEQEAAKDKIDFLTKIREEMSARFKQLAEDALKTQGDSFSKDNMEKIKAALTPIEVHVGLFEKELREMHQEGVKGRERLTTEINQLGNRTETISKEAVALTRALKGGRQKQGAWGEMVLETVLEHSGLRKGEEYEVHALRTGVEGNRQHPDVVVKLPGGKTLVIDAKLSLNDYSEAVNSDDPQLSGEARSRHAQALRQHIKLLSGKDYHRAENITVDYVIMFIPIEGALAEAMQEDNTLAEYALRRNVVLATPTTLMAVLRAVASIWAVERSNRNAEAIAERAGSLYDKVIGFVSSMENVGKHLGNSQKAYNSAFDQLSRGRGNVLRQIEMLKDLGARTNKSISADFDGAEHEIAAIAASEDTIAAPEDSEEAA